MNPFDTPPNGDPVSSPFSATPSPVAPDEPPRRGRMALVAVLTAGLVGGGIAGVSALASADKPEVALSAATADTTVPTDDPADGPDDDPADDTDEPTTDATDPAADDDDPADATKVEGELQFDVGDGEPIVIDLGDLDEGVIGRLNECIGFPNFDVTFGEPGDIADFPFEPGEFGAQIDDLFGEFGGIGQLAGDGSVTVAGPDGVSVVDLGETGSVTVTKEDGEVSISTSGDASVSDLSELFGDMGRIFGSDGDLEMRFDEWMKDLPQLGELRDFEPRDPAEVQSCIDEVLGD